MRESGEFRRLRARFAGLTLITTVAFLGWYLLYVLMSAFARDFMSRPVAGQVNVALVFGVLQILATFLLAWGYSRYARTVLDPLAERIRSEATGRLPIVRTETGRMETGRMEAGRRETSGTEAGGTMAGRPGAGRWEARTPDAVPPPRPGPASPGLVPPQHGFAPPQRARATEPPEGFYEDLFTDDFTDERGDGSGARPSGGTR